MLLKKYYSFIALLFIAIVIFLSFGCETIQSGRKAPLPGDPIAHFPKMVVGDSYVRTGWSRKYGKDTSNRKVIEVISDGSFILESTSKKGKTTFLSYYDNKYQLVKQVKKSALEKLLKIPIPPAKRLDFPLFVGKKWSSKYKSRSVDGNYYNYVDNYTVTKYETVVTKAGSFKAFKIFRRNYSTDIDASGIERYWYSPETKCEVKSKPDWRIGYELVNYKLALAEKSPKTKKQPTKAKEGPVEARAFCNQGWDTFQRGDYVETEFLYKKGIAIMDKTPDLKPLFLARCLHNLAYLYQKRKDYAKTMPLYRRALPVYERVLGSNHNSVARCLYNMAWSSYSLGDYTKAKSFYKRTLQIYEKIHGPEHPRTAKCLSGLAAIYQALGNYNNAEKLYERALKIRYAHFGSKSPEVAGSLHDLAWLYQCRRDYARAETLAERALAIPGYKESVLLINSLASCYIAQGKIDEACSLFKKTGLSLGLAACHLYRREHMKAIREFQSSLNEKTSIIGDKELAHIGLGTTYEALGDLPMAKKHFQMAINLIEEQWKTLGFSDRKDFLAAVLGAGLSRLDAYEGMVRVILKEKKQGYQKEALLYAEMVKARTLLEMLAARSIRGIGTKDQEILSKDRQYQGEISMLKEKLSELEGFGLKSSKDERVRLEKTLKQTLQDYEQFINEVKLHDSELSSLISVEAAPVESIQNLLDPSFTILEYFTTKNKTYVWLITKNDVSVKEINVGNMAILNMVNELLMPNISNGSRKRGLITILPSGIPKTEKIDLQKREKNRQRFLAMIKEFYDLLIKPIEKEIHNDRLIIVPHGALHKVPFAAIYDGKQFLLDKYTLSMVPSSTVLKYVVKKRNENQNRFLAFANPETDYVSLGFAEKEVNDISDLFSKKELYFKDKATEGRAKERCGLADIVHFASHGEFNDKQPMQSGLLLSKDIENDGYLQVHEIFGLDFRHTNLVVLSACETALCKIFSGDDLVGLSRAFIYAGTPSLLATLWSVSDRSTCTLMKEFYDNWRKSGLDKPEALRRAQIALKSMPDYQHPFYWAPFIMIGDWR